MQSYFHAGSTYMLWQHSAIRRCSDAARRRALRSGEQNRIGPPFGMCRKRHGDKRANAVLLEVGHHVVCRGKMHLGHREHQDS